jgi:enoyl-[acyl-carrier-protein] reductase (NADH)
MQEQNRREGKKLEVPRPALKGKKALVIGIANEHSIAYGCAKAFREVGAELAVTFLNDKAKPHVEPLAKWRLPFPRWMLQAGD